MAYVESEEYENAIICRDAQRGLKESNQGLISDLRGFVHGLKNESSKNVSAAKSLYELYP